jgi:hypothetical protein
VRELLESEAKDVLVDVPVCVSIAATEYMHAVATHVVDDVHLLAIQRMCLCCLLLRLLLSLAENPWLCIHSS